jgi:hypothetical protein
LEKDHHHLGRRQRRQPLKQSSEDMAHTPGDSQD